MRVECTDDLDCNSGEMCQMNQEDYNTNGVGDACECYADITHDGKVNSADLLAMKIQYNRTDCATNPCSADLNHDDKVGSMDLLILKLQYNRTGCPVVP
jgi:hypothetical protein